MNHVGGDFTWYVSTYCIEQFHLDMFDFHLQQCETELFASTVFQICSQLLQFENAKLLKFSGFVRSVISI